MEERLQDMKDYTERIHRWRMFIIFIGAGAREQCTCLGGGGHLISTTQSSICSMGIIHTVKQEHPPDKPRRVVDII
jgi:hypothetical protein